MARINMSTKEYELLKAAPVVNTCGGFSSGLITGIVLSLIIYIIV